MPPSIACTDVTFAWPDGEVVFDGLTFTAGQGRTGLIGNNGSGKSTLLRLIAGDLKPARGSVSAVGDVGYLRQDVPLDTGRTVAGLLGITPAREALRAIERGEATPENFTAVGDDWDIEERSRAELDRLGLAEIGLDRTVGGLSGGESILVGLAAQFLRRPDVLLLDEPTNNLDLDGRERLYDAVRAWPGVMVIVSHDRALLELADEIAELRDGGVRVFGGNLTAYEEAVAVEQEAAERMVRAAEADMRRQKRELAEAHEKLARRVRYGDKMAANKRVPKVVSGERKRQAQVSAGKHRQTQEDRLSSARERLDEAEGAVRDDTEIRIDLPGTEVPAGRTVLAARDLRAVASGPGPESLDELVIRGPERIALTGPNGSGKTTLLRRLVPEVPLRYLPQRLDVLDDSLSVLDNVRTVAPAAPVNAVRAGLARFLFRADRADQLAGTLSGGERFRAVLAAFLLAEPSPQFLVLDEPTNNLDMASTRQLAQALAGYHGALLVVSHDLRFLETLGITRWLTLDRAHGLRER